MAAKSERAHGPAAVLAIGTANPPNLVEQDGFADFYFNATYSNHMTDLKNKFRRICARSGIKSRYMHITEGILEANPSIRSFSGKSLDARQNMLIVEVPKLGNEAALKAIQEWGQPRSKITHLIFCTTTGVAMPGADWALTKLLGLARSVQRIMLYQQGCAAGGTVLRIAKDLAENNKGARVLVVCSELTLACFRGPDEIHMKNLIGQALFGDGAAALIVGADPIPKVEKPCFTIHWVGSCLLPGSDGAVEGHLTEAGMVVHVGREIPFLISENIHGVVKDAFHKAIGSAAPDHDDVFWIIHPGGPAILNQVEIGLQLKPAKLYASRAVLSDYGNMFSASVLFVMDRMRKRSLELNCRTTGEGHAWGVLLGFGPGLTVETVILKSVSMGD